MYLYIYKSSKDYIVQLPEEGMCTCAPGYYLAADGGGGVSIVAGNVANVKWTCSACHARYFKAVPGTKHCHQCATDYLWSIYTYL